ncbi:MAG: A/G-specific adenine glycosylase [Alphaproteobacteria bacterium]|nr:A/G-specific adenine glycosylase [Alphaproteobacteria bacterium]
MIQKSSDTQMLPENPTILAEQLLNWFYQNGRDMPWRVKGKAHPNPYAVWISEIMLQQTTVKTVVDYFQRWMHRFPTIESLAQADLQEVLLYWQGLGYYTRAKKIHECAKLLINEYNGKIPNKRELLLKLPGIGPYSASSICAFAFNQPETVVDGNVIRVIARLCGLTHAVTKEEIYHLAIQITPDNNGADYASAIMDLGATVCMPNNPQCKICPWKEKCIAYKKHLTESIPLIEKPTKKIKKGFVYLIQNENGDFYIEKRQGKGLLSGLYEFPWQENEQHFPLFTHPDWKTDSTTVSHTFTHFQLTLKLVRITVKTPDCPLKNGLFVAEKAFKNYPFSTLMKKVMKHLNTI